MLKPTWCEMRVPPVRRRAPCWARLQTLFVVLIFTAAVAFAEVPWQWEAWSQGTQRHLLGEWHPPGSSPPPPPPCPPWLSKPCKHFLDVWWTAELPKTIASSLTACKQAQGQGLYPVAGAGYAAVCHMAATSAALVAKDTAAVDRSVDQVRRIVAEFDTSFTDSLVIATRGLGESLNQLVKAPGKGEQAVSASNQAIEALSSLTVLTYSQGLSGAATHYGQIVQDARGCVTSFQQGRRDFGCSSQVTGRAEYSSLWG